MNAYSQGRPDSRQILDRLFLVDPSTLHLSIMPSAEEIGDPTREHRASQLEYISHAVDFCWEQSANYLEVLSKLEIQDRTEEHHELSIATFGLLFKVETLARQAAFTTAHGLDQIRAKLHLVQSIFWQGWDDLDQTWPDIILSLVVDVERWVSNEGRLHADLTEHCKIYHVISECRRHTRRHFHLTTRFTTPTESRSARTDALSGAIWRNIKVLRSSVQRLCEMASMTFDEAVRKGKLFQTLSHPEIVAFDTWRSDLAKSYCDDLWWLLLQEQKDISETEKLTPSSSALNEDQPV